jgi:hypothetical protein
MPFNLTNYRTPRVFWVVETRDGRGVPGRIVALGDGPYADIRVEDEGAPPVVIANGDIAGIAGGRVAKAAGWSCCYGLRPGAREVPVWCRRGDAVRRLVYRVGTGLVAWGDGGGVAPLPMSDSDFQSIQDRIAAVVEGKEGDDE